MPLEFPPVSNSVTTLVELSVAVTSKVFLFFWATSLRRAREGYQKGNRGIEQDGR